MSVVTCFGVNTMKATIRSRAIALEPTLSLTRLTSLVLRVCGVVSGECVARAHGLVSGLVGVGWWFGTLRAMLHADPSMPRSAAASRWLWAAAEAGDMFAT